MNNKNTKEIIFEQVDKCYGKNYVIKDFNLQIKDGERIILLGPSGCGKSTTLRIIAGLEDINSGNLYMSGKRVNDVPCGERNVAMVFQNYALYPHMTVAQNITYGLKAHKIEKGEIKKRLDEALEMLDLVEYAQRTPKQLSGGQRQRVALARAVVKRSPYFLLDEPLSNLDAQLRLHARKELVKIHERYHQTLVYVTHDQIEAMTVGHRIALLNKGELQMIDHPSVIYNRPANIFTAKFIGSPSMNIVDAKYGSGKLWIGKQSVHIPEIWCKQILCAETENLLLGIRPEHLIFSDKQEQDTLCATVKYVEDYGNRYGVYLEVERIELIALCEDMVPQCGKNVYINLNPEKIHLFKKENGKSIGYPKEIPMLMSIHMNEVNVNKKEK